MFENFEPIALQTQSSPAVTLRGLRSIPPRAGLPALLLLHGFPQTHHIWHRVAPALATSHALVLLDLRGYGASSTPASPPQYAKSRMAADVAAAMAQLGHRAFFVAAHDRGARVAHKLLVDCAPRVRRALLLDVCPTLAMYAAPRDPLAFARAYFHWFLLVQPHPLPEALILGAPRAFAEAFMGARAQPGDDGGDGGLRIFADECFDEYVRGLADPDTCRAMCDDYRAAASVDLDEQRADLAAGRLIKTPLRVVWARRGVIESQFDCVAEWKRVAEPGVLVEGYAVDSGHYIPEEAPEEVISAIREFLV